MPKANTLLGDGMPPLTMPAINDPPMSHSGGVPEVAPHWTWVPIRSLAEPHRGRVAAHLLTLGAADRYLRFGYSANDAQITQYVDSIDFDRDEVFGIFNRRLELIAMAHLAHPAVKACAAGPPMSEFGVSVLPGSRGRGFGSRLFERAVLHARNRGVKTLLVHALSENTAMLKIARNAGATVERDGSETEAWLQLPPNTLASKVGEIVETQAAEWDYMLKLHARQLHEPVDTASEADPGTQNTASGREG